MSVYQVNEYHIWTKAMVLSDDKKKEITDMLTGVGLTQYSFQKKGVVSVEGIGSLEEANEIEDKIYGIAGV